MHFYSPRAAAARGIKTVDEQLRGLYGAVGAGPEIVSPQLRPNEAAGGPGLMHVATSLIAGMRAKQNFLAKRDENRLRDEYQAARIAEIRQKLQPQPTRAVTIGNETFNLPEKDAATLTERMQPSAATGDARILSPQEVASHNAIVGKRYQLDPSAQHTRYEAASALTAWRDEERERGVERRTGRAAAGQAKLSAATTELNRREESEIEAGVAPYRRNVGEWAQTWGEAEAGGKKKKPTALQASARSRLTGRDFYLASARDSVAGQVGPRYARARGDLIAKHGGIDVGDVPVPQRSFADELGDALRAISQ